MYVLYSTIWKKMVVWDAGVAGLPLYSTLTAT